MNPSVQKVELTLLPIAALGAISLLLNWICNYWTFSIGMSLLAAFYFYFGILVFTGQSPRKVLTARVIGNLGVPYVSLCILAGVGLGLFIASLMMNLLKVEGYQNIAIASVIIQSLCFIGLSMSRSLNPAVFRANQFRLMVGLSGAVALLVLG